MKSSVVNIKILLSLTSKSRETPKMLKIPMLLPFVAIGKNLSQKINQPHNAKFRQYLKGNYLNSLFLRPTDSDEVLKIVMKMKSSYTPGADNI